MTCDQCRHHRQKNPARSGGDFLGPRRGPPPQCCWFWTAEGRRASNTQRTDVIIAEHNNGLGCPSADPR